VSAAPLPWEKYGQADSGPWQKYAQPEQPQQPPTVAPPAQPSATSRFLTGAKAGMGGENALNTKIDPQHPIASNPMIPGAGVYRDLKAGNLAGAAGRIAGPAAEILPMIMGGKGEIGEPQAPRPSAMGAKISAVGKLAAQDAFSHIPIAGRVARRPSLGDYLTAIKAQPKPIERPVYPGAPFPTATPEQLNPTLISPSRNLPGQIPREIINRPQPAKPIPSRPGLMLSGREPLLLPEKSAPIMLPERNPIPKQAIHGTTPSSPLPPLRTVEPPPSAPPAPVKPLEELLNNATGGKPLQRNVPLRQQGRIISEIESQPKPSTSSAIQDYKYDPGKQEMQVTTKAGAQYIHGDVSPEQAAEFEKASSKGKAWGELKKNSTYVGKIVNGQRINAKPPSSLRSASPDDLTPILQESLKNVKAKKLAAGND
jgi:hypothetical protein